MILGAKIGEMFRKIAIFAFLKTTTFFIMTQIERITLMEALLDKSEEVIKRLETALEDFNDLQPDIAELDDYCGSSDWRTDYESDEAGLLPADLKRGVLSEDALWNLLEDYQRLMETISK